MAQTASGIAFYTPAIGTYQQTEHIIKVPAADFGSHPESFLVVARQFMTLSVGPDPMSDADYRAMLIEMGLPDSIVDAAVVRRAGYGDKAKVYSAASFSMNEDGSGGNNAPKQVVHGDSVTIESGFSMRTEEDANIPKGGGTFDLVCRSAVNRVFNGSITLADVMVGWFVEYL